MHLQNWLIQQLKFSGLNLRLQILSILLLHYLRFILSLSPSEPPDGFGCSWWRFQECPHPVGEVVSSYGPEPTALQGEWGRMIGSDQPDLPQARDRVTSCEQRKLGNGYSIVTDLALHILLIPVFEGCGKKCALDSEIGCTGFLCLVRPVLGHETLVFVKHFFVECTHFCFPVIMERVSVIFAFLVCLEFSSGKSRFAFISLWTEGCSCS